MKLKVRMQKMIGFDRQRDKLWNEGCKLDARHKFGADSLKAKANGLYAKSNQLYYEAIEQEQKQIKKLLPRY